MFSYYMERALIMDAAKKLFVYVANNHNEVLEPFYRLIGRKVIPFDEMCLLHFDSHSDMSVPRNLNTDPDGSLNKYEVFSAISIENWIIPAVYSGHVDKIIWVHPYWTEQSFDKYNIFKVGRSILNNSLKVSSANNYFLSEDSYESEKTLLDPKTLHLHSFCIPSICDNPKVQNVYKDINESLGDHKSRFILDIDLDFFSTKNPFKYMFTERQYELLQMIYKYNPPLTSNEHDIEQCCSERKQQIEFLEKYFSSIQNHSDLPVNDNAQLQDHLDELVGSLQKSNPCYDFEWLHEIGTGIDDSNLPDHISTDEEIEYLVSYLEKILITLPNPLAVLMSRSSEDDYCPNEQVDNIQEKVLNLLQTLYTNVIVNFVE